MSRFDDWAKSAAQGESPLRAWRRSRTGSRATDSAGGIDRRALLKKAGLVGGATLVVGPLIQSVTSPVFAASPTVCSDPRGCGGPGCLPCAAGTSCSTGTECVSLVCNQHGVCAQLDGQSCGSGSPGQRNAVCASGKCDTTSNTCLKSSGAACLENTECASNTCKNALPLAGTPGTCK